MLVAAAPFATRGGHPCNSNSMIIGNRILLYGILAHLSIGPSMCRHIDDWNDIWSTLGSIWVALGLVFGCQGPCWVDFSLEIFIFECVEGRQTWKIAMFVYSYIRIFLYCRRRQTDADRQTQTDRIFIYSHIRIFVIRRFVRQTDRQTQTNRRRERIFAYSYIRIFVYSYFRILC